MPNDSVTVDYLPVDELPGGIASLLVVSPDKKHIDVLMSRAATVDELAAAFGFNYRALLRCSLALHAVAS